MNTNSALIFALRVSRDGVVTELNAADMKLWSADEAGSWSWIHLNRLSPEAKQWLKDTGAPHDPLVRAALLQQDTRPRSVRHNDGYLLNLRGVNLNPGARPEDMISLRIWVTRRYVITTRANRILAAEDVRAQCLAGSPPLSSGEFISTIAQRLVARMGPVIAELDEQVDEIEDGLLQRDASASQPGINGFRRVVLTLRRYIAPQREAIASFLHDSEGFVTRQEQHSLRETQDTLIRFQEDLDMIRDRALLLQEQMVEQRAEAMNTRLFVLAVISAVFLPLGFVTGLFGVNIGGMPGVENPLAFAILCIGIVIFSVAIVFWFRRLKWL